MADTLLNASVLGRNGRKLLLVSRWISGFSLNLSAFDSIDIDYGLVTAVSAQQYRASWQYEKMLETANYFKITGLIGPALTMF